MISPADKGSIGCTEPVIGKELAEKEDQARVFLDSLLSLWLESHSFNHPRLHSALRAHKELPTVTVNSKATL